MSNPAVQWVLDQLQPVVDDQPADHPLKRINRDESKLLEGDIRKRKADLLKGNYVGAGPVDPAHTTIGTEHSAPTGSGRPGGWGASCPRPTSCRTR